MRIAVVALVIAGCGADTPDEELGFIGEAADFMENGSTLGLFHVSTASPQYIYKLGDGSSVGNQFDISFPSIPPPEALDTGVGVALIGMLRGLATLPDGVVTSPPQLVGLSTSHAVIFKAPGATGPAWTARFPDGFACGQCVRVGAGIDEWEPVECQFVVVERFTIDPCDWYVRE